MEYIFQQFEAFDLALNGFEQFLDNYRIDAMSYLPDDFQAI